MNQPTFQTPRLLLRPFTLDDTSAFFAYAKKSTIGPSAGWEPHASIEDSRRILAHLIEETHPWALIRKNTNKLIGSIDLHPDMKRPHEYAKALGYALDDLYWGQGLMVEAIQAMLQYGFLQLGLTIITAYHYPYNKQSQRVLIKTGFQYEGRLRCAAKRYDGHIYDQLCYSIMKNMYQMS